MNLKFTAFCTACGQLISGVRVDLALEWLRSHSFGTMLSDRDYDQMIRKVLAEAETSLQPT